MKHSMPGSRDLAGAGCHNSQQKAAARAQTDEKEKGKQGGRATKQPGNLKPPSFHEHATTEVLGVGTLKMWLQGMLHRCHTSPCKYGFQTTFTLHMDKVLHNSSAPSGSLLELAEAVNSRDNCQEVPGGPTHTCPTGENANTLD